MANNVTMNVKPSFEMAAFANKLSDMYRSKGYKTNVMDLNGNYSITIEKGNEGFNKYIGLGEGIRVNCMLNDGTLTITFSDAEWTGKIIALGVGFFLCCIVFITGIVGCIKQSSLPKDIETNAMMIASSL